MAIRSEGTLNKFFSQKTVADVVAALPKPATPWTDMLFPQAKRTQKASPFVTTEEVTEVTGAIPLILRGASSYPVDNKKETRKLIEVDPLSPSVFVSARDINDLIALGSTQSVQAFVTEKIEYLRNRVSQSIEVMTKQAFSEGKLHYPMWGDNGIEGYADITLGETKKLPGTSLKGFDIAKLQNWLADLWQKHADNTGSTGDVVAMMGTSVYNEVIKIMVAAGSNAPIVYNSNGLPGAILFGFYKIMGTGATYTLPDNKGAKKVLADNTVRVVDLSNAGKLIYAALDDIDANLAPLPFYAKPIYKKDPDGVKIVGQSKPIPALAMGNMSEQAVATA